MSKIIIYKGIKITYNSNGIYSAFFSRYGILKSDTFLEMKKIINHAIKYTN